MTNGAIQTEKPFRVGIFSSVENAERAVRLLLQAGFSKQQVSVICSDEAKQHHFHDIAAPHPTPENDANAAIGGGAIGGLLGGLVAVAMTTGAGLPLIVIGPGIFGGAIAGTLVGAMSTRGEKKETADFYDQAVTEGQLLVAVEYHGPDGDEVLARAEEVFRQAGAEPLPLAEG